MCSAARLVLLQLAAIVFIAAPVVVALGNTTDSPPTPSTEEPRNEVKTALKVFFVTLGATATTGLILAVLYWAVSRRKCCFRDVGGPAPTRRPASENNAARNPHHTSNADIPMQERLLPSRSVTQMEDNCDGDADGEVAPAAAYYASGDRFEFLLLPEYAASAGGRTTGSRGSDPESDRTNRVALGPGVAGSKKLFTEWLNGIVAVLMESQLSGIPLDSPVPTLYSTSPPNASASDKSDSDSRPVRRLKLLRRTSDSSSSTQPSLNMATGATVEFRHSPQQHSATTTDPLTVVVPLRQLLEEPHGDSVGVPMPTQQNDSPPPRGGDTAAPKSSPRLHLTPRRILHDTSSSSSDVSATHAAAHRNRRK